VQNLKNRITGEAVEKPLQHTQWMVVGGLMTPPNYEIVDCGAFCEVIFFASYQRVCLGTFSTVSEGRLHGDHPKSIQMGGDQGKISLLHAPKTEEFIW